MRNENACLLYRASGEAATAVFEVGACHTEEMFRQGDLEARLQLLISAGCDRRNPMIGKSQRFYKDYIFLPLWNPFLSVCLPRSFASALSTYMEENNAYWQSLDQTSWSHAELSVIPPPSSLNARVHNLEKFGVLKSVESSFWSLLEIRVLEATNLAATDANGFSDPYVKLRLDGRREVERRLDKCRDSAGLQKQRQKQNYLSRVE